MRLESKTHGGWRVIDAATGAEIKDVTMLDDVRKEMSYYVRDSGKLVTEDDPRGGRRVKQETISLRALHLDTQARLATVYRK